VKVLDCENDDSIYKSLEEILGVSRSRLETVFDGFDVETAWKAEPETEPNRLVLSEVRKASSLLGNSEQTCTCWFHLTRTPPENQFESGILPLGHSLGSTWDFLGGLAAHCISMEEWNTFREKIGSLPPVSSSRNKQSRSLYNMKTANAFHWGPYGILVLDHASNPKENGLHDYLSSPEIVEDICGCFSDYHPHFDLLERFKAKSRPCVVKFLDAGQQSDGDEFLSIAVHHLYRRWHNLQCSQYCNTCYDGRGQPVKRQQILKIFPPPFEVLA
jgi:hypothetical protein